MAGKADFIVGSAETRVFDFEMHKDSPGRVANALNIASDMCNKVMKMEKGRAKVVVELVFDSGSIDRVVLSKTIEVQRLAGVERIEESE